jgi:hypothetical protein
LNELGAGQGPAISNPIDVRGSIVRVAQWTSVV